jgi:hypothetical protein
MNLCLMHCIKSTGNNNDGGVCVGPPMSRLSGFEAWLKSAMSNQGHRH